MKVYEFRNKIKNTQIWPRCFVAISLCEAIKMAQEFEDCMNEANGYAEHLLFTFDYQNGKMIETNRCFYKKGYVEL
ncbi:MAG: hypothetical protein KQ78_01492 [Candidatus Izimaplasma bacterium HR2]|nr:MAG: hypothetical protein KQ78_01492 [Candidatus Izimaplasma bacterium HR2]